MDEVADLFFANLKVVSPTLFTKDGRTSKDNKPVTPKNVKFWWGKKDDTVTF